MPTSTRLFEPYLPHKARVEIMSSLDNFKDLVNLRLTCKAFNNAFLRSGTAILTSLAPKHFDRLGWHWQLVLHILRIQQVVRTGNPDLDLETFVAGPVNERITREDFYELCQIIATPGLSLIHTFQRTEALAVLFLERLEPNRSWGRFSFEDERCVDEVLEWLRGNNRKSVEMMEGVVEVGDVIKFLVGWARWHWPRSYHANWIWDWADDG